MFHTISFSFPLYSKTVYISFGPFLFSALWSRFSPPRAYYGEIGHRVTLSSPFLLFIYLSIHTTFSLYFLHFIFIPYIFLHNSRLAAVPTRHTVCENICTLIRYNVNFLWDLNFKDKPATAFTTVPVTRTAPGIYSSKLIYSFFVSTPCFYLTHFLGFVFLFFWRGGFHFGFFFFLFFCTLCTPTHDTRDTGDRS